MGDAPAQPGADPKANDNPNDGGKGEDPKGNESKTDGGNTGEVDLTKLPGDQVQKVLENPELWKTDRMKQLREKAARADELEKAQKETEEKSLEEQKKFKELADKRAEEVKSLQEKVQKSHVDQVLTSKLVSEKVVNLGDALTLVDRSAIKVDEKTGEVDESSVDAALKSLKENKAYLFTNPSGSGIGSPTNPGEGGGDPTAKRFKRSQLKDPVFYKENREEILKAQKAGLIEDDVA